MKSVGVLLLLALSPGVLAQYSSHQLVADWPATPRALGGYPYVLLAGPGLSEYRVVNASGSWHLGRGHWGEAPEMAVGDSGFTSATGSRITGVLAADGSTVVLSNCRVIRYDPSFRPVFRTGPLQLTTYQDPGCFAVAATSSGNTYVRDSGDGVLVIDPAGVQQDPLPLALPSDVYLDSAAMVAVGDRIAVAGNAGPGRPWVAVSDEAGQILWSRVIDTADIGAWSAQLAVEGGQIHALFATSEPGGARTLLRRFDVDGNEVATGHADTLVPAFPDARLVVRGGSTVVDTGDDRLLLWRAGQSAPMVLAAPDAAPIFSFDVAADGRVFALSDWQVLRFETNGTLGAVVDPRPAWLPLRLSVIDSNRIVVSAWLDAAEHVGIAQFDSNLAMQRVDPLIGTPRLSLSLFAEGGAKRYLLARDSEIPAESLLIATDAKGREFWRRSGNFTRMVADSQGVWVARDGLVERFGANGEQLGSQDLATHLATGEFPRLFAGQFGEVYLDSSVVPQAPGECRVVVVNLSGIEPLASQPCGDSRVIGVDGEVVRTYQSALVRTRRDGTQRFSIPITGQQSVSGIHTDGSVLVLGLSNWQSISADGVVRWSLPRSALTNEVDAFILGSDVAFRVYGAAPVTVGKHRLADGVLIGETQLGHVGERLNIGAARVDADGRLLLVGERRVDSDNWVLTTHVVEPDLSLRVPQVWTRGASTVRGLWSELGSVYLAIGSPLDYRQNRPAIIRAGGEIWVNGFED